jgi:putative oxidoreductase
MRNLFLLRFLRPFAPLGWALVRFLAGAMLSLHGLEKLRDGPAGFADFLRGLGAPAPEAAAWLSTLGELLGGGLLAIGLFTRPAGLVVAINMATAIALAHAGDFGKIGTGKGGVIEYPLLLCAVGVAAAFQGGGPISVDRLTIERPKPPAPPPPSR